MNEIFSNQRLYSKVAESMKNSRIEKLRSESAETKLLRAIELHKAGKNLKEVRKIALKS